jgi:beta propeller repeat protein
MGLRTTGLSALAALMLSAATQATTIVAEQTIQITNAPGVQKNPSISGDRVVWANAVTGQVDGYNLATNLAFAVTTSGLAKNYPHISGNVVTWTEKSSGFGFGYGAKDLGTGQVLTLVSGMQGYIGNSYIAVAGRNVYYTVYDKPGMTQGIYRTNLDTGVQTRISPTYSGYQHNPDAKGDWVVWNRDDGKMNLFNVTTGENRLITIPGGGFVHDPVLADGKVVYIGNYNSNSTNNRIESYEISTEAFGLVSGSDLDLLLHPSASGSIATWTNGRSVPADFIDAADLSSGLRFRAVDRPDEILHTQQAFEIDGLRVAWTRTNSAFDNMDIFVTQIIPEPGAWGIMAVAMLVRMGSRKNKGVIFIIVR